MRKGFTLIELAIVVVVLGILVTGIIGGQSLIESSKRQKIYSEFSQYRNAISAYRLEYDAMPGDHDEATDYFTTYHVTHNPTGVLNGDGDGKTCCWRTYYGGRGWESYKAWRHLWAAELVGKEYRGAYVFNNAYADLDVPESSYQKGMGWVFQYAPHRDHDIWTDSNESIYGNRGHYLGLGVDQFHSDGCNHGNSLVCGAFAGQTAYSIDKKFDDGSPRSGQINALVDSGGSNSCLQGSGTNLIYNKSQSEAPSGHHKCRMVFHLPF